MTLAEFRETLEKLNIGRTEVAQLLHVNKRTVDRWAEGDQIPGPAEAALKAWRSLNDRGLAWKPDSISVLENDADQIERQRLFSIRFNEMLEDVERSGGPQHPWKVDVHDSTATFGTAEVSFHKLANGGFSISSYRRTDRLPDRAEDMPLIRDAAYCIAKEFSRLGERADALSKMADYVTEHSDKSARNGPTMLTPKESVERKRRIEKVAQKLRELANDARRGYDVYYRYEDLLGSLHTLGFFPTDAQVAAVARAFI